MASTAGPIPIVLAQANPAPPVNQAPTDDGVAPADPVMDEEREEPTAADEIAEAAPTDDGVAPAGPVMDEEREEPMDEEREEPTAADETPINIAEAAPTDDGVAPADPVMDEEREEPTADAAASPDPIISASVNTAEDPFKDDTNIPPPATDNNGDDIPDEEYPEEDDNDPRRADNSDADSSSVSDDSNASSTGGNKDPAVVAAMLDEGDRIRIQQEAAERQQREALVKREAAILAAKEKREQQSSMDKRNSGGAPDDETEKSNEAPLHAGADPDDTDVSPDDAVRRENASRQREIIRALGGLPNNFFGVDVTTLKLSRFVPPEPELIVDEDDELSGDDEETLARKRRNRKRKAKLAGGKTAAAAVDKLALAPPTTTGSRLSTTTIDGKDLAALFPQSVQEEVDLIVASLRDTENAIMGRGENGLGRSAAAAVGGGSHPSVGSAGEQVVQGREEESQFVYRQLYSALSAPIGISDPRVLLGLDEGFFGKVDSNADAFSDDQRQVATAEGDDTNSVTTSNILARMSMQQRVELAKLIYEGKIPAGFESSGPGADLGYTGEEVFYCCGSDPAKAPNPSRVITSIQHSSGGGRSQSAGPILLLLGKEQFAGGVADSTVVVPAPTSGRNSPPRHLTDGGGPSPSRAAKLPAKEEFVAWRRWTELNPQACVFGNGGQPFPDTNNNEAADSPTPQETAAKERRLEMTVEEIEKQYRRETEVHFEHIPPMPPGSGIVPSICIHHLPPLSLLPKVYTEYFTSTLAKSRKAYEQEIATLKAIEEKKKAASLNSQDDAPLTHNHKDGTPSSQQGGLLAEGEGNDKKKKSERVTLYGPGTFQPSFLPSILDDHFFLLGLIACLNAHPPYLPELHPAAEDAGGRVAPANADASLNRPSSPDGLNDDTLRGVENGLSEAPSGVVAPQTAKASSPFSFFNLVFASLEHIDRGLLTVRAFEDAELDLKPYLTKLEGETETGHGHGKSRRPNHPKSKSVRKRQQDEAAREKDPSYFKLVVPLPVYVTLDTMLPAATAAYSIANTIESELERNPSRAAKYRYNRSLPPADIDHIVGRTFEDGTECWAPLLAKAYATIKQRQYLRHFTTGEKSVSGHLRDIGRDSPATNNLAAATNDDTNPSKLFQYLGGYAALHGGSAPDVVKTFLNPDESVYVQWNNKAVSAYYNTSFYEPVSPSATPSPTSPEIKGSISMEEETTLNRVRAATERQEKKIMLRGLAAAARTAQGFAKDQLWWMLRQATDAHQPTLLTDTQLCSNSVGSAVSADPARMANGIPACSFGTVPAPIDGFTDEFNNDRPSSGRAEAFDNGVTGVGGSVSLDRPNSAGSAASTASSIGRLKHPDYRLRFNSYSASEFALGKVPDGGSTSEKTVGNVSMTGSMMGFGNRSMSLMSTMNGSLANLGGSVGSDGAGAGGKAPMPIFNWDFGVVVLCAVEVNLDADSTVLDPYARAMLKKRRKAEREEARRRERIAQGEDPNAPDEEDAEDQAAEEEEDGMVRLVKVRSVYRTNHPNYSKLRGEWAVPGGGGKPQDGNDDTTSQKKAKNGHWTPYLQEQLQYSVDVVREQQSENLVWWMSIDELISHFNFMYTGMNVAAYSTQSLVPFYASKPPQKHNTQEDTTNDGSVAKSSSKHVLSMPACSYLIPPARLQQAVEMLKNREAAALKRELGDPFKGKNATVNRHGAAAQSGHGGARKSSLSSRRASHRGAAVTATLAAADVAAATESNDANEAAAPPPQQIKGDATTAGSSSVKPVEYESPALMLSLLEGSQYFNPFAGMDEAEVDRIQQSLPAPPASKTANPALSQEQQAEREEEEEKDNLNNHNSVVVSKIVPVVESPGPSYAAPFYPHFLLCVEKVHTGKVDEAAGLAAIAGFDFTGAGGGPNLLRFGSIFGVKPGPVAMGTQLKVVKKMNPQTGAEEDSEEWTETDDENNALGQSTTTTATTTATNLAAQAASQNALQLKFTLKMPIPPGVTAAAKASAPPKKSSRLSASSTHLSARARRIRNTMASGIFSSFVGGGDNGSVASYQSTSTTAANAATTQGYPTDFVVQLFRVPTASRQACVRTLVPVGGAVNTNTSTTESAGIEFPELDVVETESVVADQPVQQQAVKPVYNLPAHTQVNVRPSLVKSEKTEKQKEKERKDRQASLASGKPLVPTPPTSAQESPLTSGAAVSTTLARMTAAELVDGDRYFRATFEAEVNSGMYNVVIAPAANDPHTATYTTGLEQPSSSLPPPVTSVNACLNMPTFAHLTVEKSGKNRRGYRCGVFHLPK